MTESLRHVTHCLAADCHFFGEDSQMVGKGEDIVEAGDGFTTDVVAAGKSIRIFACLFRFC